MTDILPWEFDRRSETLLIHFDVNGHYLNLDTFVRTAESTKKVIDALDKTFFQEALEYEFIVLAPEEGSFLTKLGLAIVGGVGTVFAFLNSDVGSSYIEGLTGKPPSIWAQEIGESHRDHAKKVIEEAEEQTSDSRSAPDTKQTKDSKQEEALCKMGAKLITAMTRGILEASNDRLTKIGMEVGDLPDAMEARAEFYEACIEDKKVKRIGFTSDHDFPIPRNSFPERAIKPERKKKEDTPPEWVVTIESIYVTSPQWDEADQNARQWKGKDAIRRDCYFIIEDSEFWHRVKRKELHPEVLDKLKVQWACQIVDGKPRNRRVLRVLEFNGDKLADPLTDEAINTLLGVHTTNELSKDQPSLFDE